MLILIRPWSLRHRAPSCLPKVVPLRRWYPDSIADDCYSPQKSERHIAIDRSCRTERKWCSWTISKRDGYNGCGERLASAFHLKALNSSCQYTDFRFSCKTPRIYTCQSGCIYQSFGERLRDYQDAYLQQDNPTNASPAPCA